MTLLPLLPLFKAQSALDTLGPLIIAFLVLIYYGLRLLIAPPKKRKFHFNHDTDPNDYLSEQGQDSLHGFVFSDPIAEPTQKTKPTANLAKPDPYSTKKSHATKQAHKRSQWRSTTSAPSNAAELFERVEAGLFQRTSTSVHMPVADNDKSIVMTPASLKTPSSLPVDPPVQTDTIARKHPYSLPPAYKKATPRSTSTTPRISIQRTYLHHNLRNRLRSPQKNMVLKESILISELLNKPLALRRTPQTYNDDRS